MSGTPQEFTLTGTEELSIYPNPVINTLSIETPLNLQSAAVFNYAGKQVKEINLNGTKQANVQELAPGIYIIKITTADGNVITKKIMTK